jgi:hypothetical protein
MKKGTGMSIENIIRAWKADEDQWEAPLVASPVGEELTEEELQQVCGGLCLTNTICTLTNCLDTCGSGITCRFTCGATICVATAAA